MRHIDGMFDFFRHNTFYPDVHGKEEICRNIISVICHSQVKKS